MLTGTQGSTKGPPQLSVSGQLSDHVELQLWPKPLISLSLWVQIVKLVIIIKKRDEYVFPRGEVTRFKFDRAEIRAQVIWQVI